MPTEWIIERFGSQMKKCPTCGSAEGFWVNYGLANSYIQCKHCGARTQFYHVSQIKEETQKGEEDWKSALGLIVGVAGLILVVFGLIFGTLAEFPFSWIALTIIGITMFASGLIVTVLTETERTPTTERKIAVAKY